MTGAGAGTPILAWLLTALTCLLVSLALVEGRRQTVALPAIESFGVVGPGEIVDSPTPAPEPPPTPTVLFADVPVSPSASAANLQVARLTVSPAVALPPEVAAGPTVLLVESGSLSVRVYGTVGLGQGLDVAQTETVLNHGDRLVVAAGARYALRNDGPTPAEALVVAIVPGAMPTPMLGPGEPPLPTAQPGAACHCP